MPDEFEAFKTCLRNEAVLELEAWDVLLFQPLKDLHAWWTRQSDSTKLFTAFLTSQGSVALARWLSRIASIATAKVAALFAEALTAAVVGLGLAALLDVVGRCIAQVVA
jgi:hypothetical protein